MTALNLIALSGIPLVEPGDDLASLILAALERDGLTLQEGDVLVLAQKIVSKAEGRYAYLNDVTPSAEALRLAPMVHKDPAQVQLVLDESVEVLRTRPGVIIVEHRNGYVHANAGIDRSNIKVDERGERLLLLPENPDRSAAELRAVLQRSTGVAVNVIINDSAGRAWRQGTLGFAIGTAGFKPLVSMIGAEDLFGRPLEITEVAVADELAAAASFLMGQAAEGAPVVLIRGARLIPSDEGSGSLIRPKPLDMFR